MRKMIVTAIVLSGLWIAAAPAAGAFPSVDSATDQYVEYIPGVTGLGDGGAKDPGSASLPEKVIKKLEQQGDDGAAAAILAQSSAPPAYPDDAGTGSPGGNRGQGGSSGDRAATAPVSPGQAGQGTETSGFSAVFSNIGGSGIGMFLPILLLLTVVGVISIRLIEARRGRGKPQA